MKCNQFMFRLSLALASIFFSGAKSTKLTVKNNCPFTVWPGLSADDLRTSDHPFPITGFELASNASKTLDVSPPWTGLFWARTNCSKDSNGNFTCATGDCHAGQVSCNGRIGKEPITFTEFSLAWSRGHGKDLFYISLEFGFNLPLSVAPEGSFSGCTAVSCAADVNVVCPKELQVKSSDGSIVGCKNACVAFKKPQYCCTEDYSSPKTCPPTNYSMIFKKQCPQAISYAYDDNPSLAYCVPGTNYDITFCP